MFDLKPISIESIPEALALTERYRLLNDSWLAESICLDILRVAPNHQQALKTLLLSITDQFSDGVPATRARALLSQIDDPYTRLYHTGLICEREARAICRRAAPMWGVVAYDLLRDAMAWYEKAEAIRAGGNDDAILRWNTCARMLMREPALRPRMADPVNVLLDD